jgi:hypothetical protein
MIDPDPVDPGAFVHPHGPPQCGATHDPGCPVPPGEEQCVPQPDGTFSCTHTGNFGQPPSP